MAAEQEWAWEVEFSPRQLGLLIAYSHQTPHSVQQLSLCGRLGQPSKSALGKTLFRV